MWKFIFTLELFLTHLGPFYPVALPPTQVRFVPDSIDNPRLDPRTVEQSVPDLVTHLCSVRAATKV